MEATEPTPFYRVDANYPYKIAYNLQTMLTVSANLRH